MADTFSKLRRSAIMRRVKSSRNRSTELELIRYFRSKKIVGWRRNCRLFGKPDFTFRAKRVVIFVDGCFWHGHRCRNTRPKSNQDYWTTKIMRNRARDRLVTRTLAQKGWLVYRIWECELKDDEKLGKLTMILKQ
jgi:DNA mismatch endonuclease (patch repair protein)